MSTLFYMSLKKNEMFIFISSSIVCPKISLVHILGNFSITIHILVEEVQMKLIKENIQVNFIGTLSFCTRKN